MSFESDVHHLSFLAKGQYPRWTPFGKYNPSMESYTITTLNRNEPLEQALTLMVVVVQI